MDDLQAIARRLKDLREAKGLTQRAVSNATDIDVSSISLYERGGVESPSIAIMSALATLYGTTLDYIVRGTVASASASEPELVDRAGVLRIVADWLDTPEGRAASEDDVRWAQGLSFHQAGEPLTADIISALYRSRRARLAGKGVADGTVVPAPKDPKKRKLK